MKNRKKILEKRSLEMSLNENTKNERYIPSDFSKLVLGAKTLQDAVLSLGDYKRISPQLGDKEAVLSAISRADVSKMRQISNYFYRTSGIYARLCRYMAFLYKYDWFITPYIKQCQGLIKEEENEQSQQKQKEKQFSNFFKVLKYFENSEIKKFFGEVALKVIKWGCYYGYRIIKQDKMVIQQLPLQYCRSRFKVDNRPVVEFNMQYFKDTFPEDEQRKRMVSLFPKDFQKGYRLFQQGKLMPTFPGDGVGWYVLDLKCAVKFNINDEDFPAFIAVIPAIIDLNAAQDLDRKRMAQKLLRILIQQLPLDKNGDLVFDIDEAKQLHNNAVKMLSKAIGVDVLTTFANVDVADMSDRSNTTSVDELGKIERAVYNEAGVSQLQFNSDGNIALTNSVLNDQASMYNLLAQFESFLNLLLEPFNKSPKRCSYRAQILTTTIYNYKDMAKLYKQQAQMGYTKMLPAVALGQSQSSVLANAYFENDILDLVSVFVPPLTSNTMNAEALENRKNVTRKNKSSETGESGEVGRPEKEDSQKSEKTIQNKQAM